MPKTKATFIDPMLLPGGRNSRKVRIGRMRLSWTGTVSWPSRAAAKCNCDRATITTSRNATPPLPLRCARCRMKPCWRVKWLRSMKMAGHRSTFCRTTAQPMRCFRPLPSQGTWDRDEEDVTLSEPDCIVSLDLCCLRKSARERYFDLLRNE